jgi:hypothetical protein
MEAIQVRIRAYDGVKRRSIPKGKESPRIFQIGHQLLLDLNVDYLDKINTAANKQSRTADKGWSFSLVVGRDTNKSL